MSQDPDTSNTPQINKSSISEEDLDDMLAGLGALHKDTELDPSLIIDHNNSATAESVEPPDATEAEELNSKLVVTPDEHVVVDQLASQDADLSPINPAHKSQKFSLIGFIRRLFSRNS